MSPVTFRGLAFFSWANAGPTARNAKMTAAQIRSLFMFVSSSSTMLFALLCLDGVLNGRGYVLPAFLLVRNRGALSQVDVAHLCRLGHGLLDLGLVVKICGDELPFFSDQNQIVLLQVEKPHIPGGLHWFYLCLGRLCRRGLGYDRGSGRWRRRHILLYGTRGERENLIDERQRCHRKQAFHFTLLSLSEHLARS